ncbi:MAG: class II aldolase/adducin family protein [Actinobacteria bacterium]|nr:class II aldolase/adducin family protein [Actinomycetota bacterium]
MGVIVMHENLKKEIAKYSNLAYQRELVGAAGGNISARFEDVFLITAGGKSLRDVTSEDIIIVDESGSIIDGKEGVKPSKETSLHISIYKNRPDIDSVIHVHPCYCTAYSIKKKAIPILTASAKLKLKKVPVIGYANPGSAMFAGFVAQCVKESPEYVKALTLEAHGLIAWDKGLSGCFDIAELVEETARVAFIAEQIK